MLLLPGRHVEVAARRLVAVGVLVAVDQPHGLGQTVQHPVHEGRPKVALRLQRELRVRHRREVLAGEREEPEEQQLRVGVDRRDGFDELAAAPPRKPAGRIEVAVVRPQLKLLRAGIVLGVDQQAIDLSLARDLGERPHVADRARPCRVVVPREPPRRSPECGQVAMRKPRLALELLKVGDLAGERLLGPYGIGQNRGHRKPPPVGERLAERDRDAVESCLRELVGVADDLRRRDGEQVPAVADQLLPRSVPRAEGHCGKRRGGKEENACCFHAASIAHHPPHGQRGKADFPPCGAG